MSVKKNKKVIKANAIHLHDSEGNLRILLDADQRDGFASIVLFSKSLSHQIELTAQPDDRVELSVRGRSGLAHATIVISPEANHCSIMITDPDGQPAVTIGRLPYVEEPHQADVRLYQEGQPIRSLRDNQLVLEAMRLLLNEM